MLKSRRGQGVVELAFVLPIFLLVVMGIWDFGRVFHCYSSLSYMVNSAARKASEVNFLYQRFTAGMGDAFRYTANSHAPLQDVQAAFNNARSPLMEANQVTFLQSGVGVATASVTITGTYNVTLITPLFSSFFSSSSGQTSTITLVCTATETKE